ncbi:MAG: hypothetical protein ACM3NH_04655 [Candidatus Saccharibacteria bacterium]
MKQKTRKKQHKEKRYFGLRLHPGWTIKKSTRFFRRLAKATGIPEAYADTTAWFAERLILAGVCIAVASFAFGVLFALKLSPPIADSQAYVFLENKALVAKAQVIDITSPIFGKLVMDNYEEPDLTEPVVVDHRKLAIKKYLQTKNSPFAADDDTITALAEARNTKLILAISFVESNFGKHCYYHNCSGIGGSVPNLRKYDSYAEWVKDFDNLLEARYKGLPPEKFLGLYVQPGSPNWLYGVRQVLKEVNDQGLG